MDETSVDECVGNVAKLFDDLFLVVNFEGDNFGKARKELFAVGEEIVGCKEGDKKVEHEFGERDDRVTESFGNGSDEIA